MARFRGARSRSGSFICTISFVSACTELRFDPSPAHHDINMPPFAIIIPARYASSRFPAKPLAPLVGATGIAKPLIQRSWECAMQIPGAAGIWVATDDHRIAEVVTGFGGQVILTSPDRENGTARCAE
ncbi:MAG: cytidylyltransferase domain-containing protein, partial [Sphingomonadales bacterium]